jgi:hypothetical protein
LAIVSRTKEKENETEIQINDKKNDEKYRNFVLDEKN